MVRLARLGLGWVGGDVQCLKMAVKMLHTGEFWLFINETSSGVLFRCIRDESAGHALNVSTYLCTIVHAHWYPFAVLK